MMYAARHYTTQTCKSKNKKNKHRKSRIYLTTGNPFILEVGISVIDLHFLSIIGCNLLLETFIPRGFITN